MKSLKGLELRKKINKIRISGSGLLVVKNLYEASLWVFRKEGERYTRIKNSPTSTFFELDFPGFLVGIHHDPGIFIDILKNRVGYIFLLETPIDNTQNSTMLPWVKFWKLIWKMFSYFPDTIFHNSPIFLLISTRIEN